MRDVVEVQSRKREQLEVFVAAHVADGELVGLRLECPHHETLEPVCDILRLAHVIQMLDDFFGGFDAAEDDIRAAGEPLLVAGGERVAPYLRGELFRAQDLAHTVGENFGTGARNGTEACRLENIEQLVKRNGLHEVSKGDYIYNGEIVEIKYLTKKTGASKDLKGTIAQKYLIGFNSGEEIILKLIDKKDLKTRVDGKRLKITYQDNIGLGVRVK